MSYLQSNPMAFTENELAIIVQAMDDYYDGLSDRDDIPEDHLDATRMIAERFDRELDTVRGA